MFSIFIVNDNDVKGQSKNGNDNNNEEEVKGSSIFGLQTNSIMYGGIAAAVVVITIIVVTVAVCRRHATRLLFA